MMIVLQQGHKKTAATKQRFFLELNIYRKKKATRGAPHGFGEPLPEMLFSKRWELGAVGLSSR